MLRSAVLLLALCPGDARVLQSLLPSTRVVTPNPRGVLRRAVAPVALSAAPRGGGTSSQLQIMDMDDAQDVLVDWTQRALLYSQTDEWDLARAEMTAIEEMQGLRKFAVSSDLKSRKFAKLVLGMYVASDAGEELRALAAVKLGKRIGFVVCNVVVHPAELIDTESTAALRFHLALRALSEELRMPHTTEGDCVALERGSLDTSKISILPMDLWNMPKSVEQLSADLRPSPSPSTEAPAKRWTYWTQLRQSLDASVAAEDFAIAQELQVAVDKLAAKDAPELDAKARELEVALAAEDYRAAALLKAELDAAASLDAAE